MDIRRAIVHELSNKVSTLKVLAELKEKELGKEFLMALEDIDTLVRWLLDVHLSERGKKGEVKINLKRLIEDVIDEVGLILKLRQVSVSVKGCEDTYIFSDEFILKRIMYNVVHNAVKFSPSEADVSVKCIRSDEYVEISIENLVNEEENKKGSGLGLQITKDLVECLGGEINFKLSNGVAITKIRLPLK